MTLPAVWPQRKSVTSWEENTPDGIYNRGWNSAIKACEQSLEAGKALTKEEIMALFKDHYWDSYESEKEIILKHIDFVVDLVLAKIPAQQGEK